MVTARSFVVKISFICMRIKNQLHILFYTFTLILTLEQRLGETRKWPIREGALIIQKGRGGTYIGEIRDCVPLFEHEVIHSPNLHPLPHHQNHLPGPSSYSFSSHGQDALHHKVNSGRSQCASESPDVQCMMVHSQAVCEHWMVKRKRIENSSWVYYWNANYMYYWLSSNPRISW